MKFTTCRFTQWGFAGNVDKAIDCWLKSLELEAGQAQLHLLLSQAYESKGIIEKVIIHLEKLIELHPDHPLAIESAEKIKVLKDQK